MSTKNHHKWYPIASSGQVVQRHIFHAQLLGREFAVWRADDGFVNVWENRCLHRGVRLTIGINDGAELQCQYHGWRYANRTAGCTYIPAHPADAPARRMCNNVYPTGEAYGLIWAGELAQGELPRLTGLETSMVLRPIPVNAPQALVLGELRAYSFSDSCACTTEDEDSVSITSGDGNIVRLFVQPQDSNKSVIRGVTHRPEKDADRVNVLQEHNWLLQEMRSMIELKASRLDEKALMIVEYSRAPEGFAYNASGGTTGRTAELRVQVAEKKMTTGDVVILKLKSIKGQLPTFQPGAHIDVHLQNGLIRQYSLTNGPGETGHYTIGVKREPNGLGGSTTIHDTVSEGDVLAVSAPRNNFPLRRDALRTILIAGGIGVTPILSMARALCSAELPFEFHYFTQSEDHIAFRDVIEGLGDAVTHHIGLAPNETAIALKFLLQEPGFAEHVYICGPGPMLEATRRICAASGWADENIHFEYFKNTTQLDNSNSFDIDLARSGITLKVPAGKTILEVLRENHINMASSCEQGACGTCRVDVLDGDVHHQDVYLNPSEKAEGKSIMTCVSRAKSARLMLDI